MSRQELGLPENRHFQRAIAAFCSLDFVCSTGCNDSSPGVRGMSESQILGNLSAFAVCRAAMECESFREAGSRLQVDNLGEILAGSNAMRSAWDRGWLLRRVREIAESPVCEAAAAERLGFDQAGFKTIRERDQEIRDVWEQGRHAFYVKSKAVIMVAAERGAVHAVRALERLLQSETGIASPGEHVDFTRLTATEMEQTTKTRRQQLLRWQKDQGLPVGPDGRYSLPAFITWLRRNPRIGRVRKYARKPGAIEARIVGRIQQVLREELGARDDAAREETPTLFTAKETTDGRRTDADGS
jgi:hypothetical protein